MLTRALPLLLVTGCLTARPPSPEPIDRTPERLARGEYLALHVADCLGCHSPRDWTKPWGPVLPGLEGAGGAPMAEADGVPGVAVPGNLTPDEETGLGHASDGALLRGLREGVGHDGRALFPVMPYVNYRGLSDEDARSVVVWLKTLKPVRRPQPPTRIDFPVSLFIRGVPRPVDGVSAPPDDEVSRGRYLVTLAGCRECHSPLDGRGRIVKGKALAGGRPFSGQGFSVTSPPLDLSATSFLTVPRTAFIARFKTPVPPTSGNSVMPWPAFSGLTEDDLGAIYEALRVEASAPK